MAWTARRQAGEYRGGADRLLPDVESERGVERRQSKVKVFLSASAVADTTEVRRLLEAAGLTVTTGDSIPAGGTWVDALLGHLRDCDAVAIYPLAERSDAVLVEAGAALGAGLPAVVIVDRSEDRAAVPSALRELPTIALDGDIAATSERLATMLISLMSARTHARQTRTAAPAGTEGRPRWESGRLMQERAAAVFAREGARVVFDLKMPEGQRRVDFAASMPNLLAPAFDPVLIEVVSGHSKSADGGVSQVREFQQALGLLIGVVVVPGDDSPTWDISDHSAVVVIGLGRLESLSPGELAKLLSDGRNKLVHGVA